MRRVRVRSSTAIAAGAAAAGAIGVLLVAWAAGWLHGEQKTVVVRDAAPEGKLEPILDRIRHDGLPNYYGPQRFGRDGETLLLGMATARTIDLAFDAAGVLNLDR